MYNRTTAKAKLIPLEHALGVIKQSGTLKVFCPNENCRNSRNEHTSWGIRIFDGKIDENELQCRNCGSWISTEWTGN